MKKFYCAAPWRGLHINPQGNVKTCCAGDLRMSGNLNSNSIEEILNSTAMGEIRQSLSQGTAHAYCNSCVKAEEFGADSERAWHNNSNANFDYASAGDKYHYPVIFDVRWNTTCNLSCNYCEPDYSSKWASLKGVAFKSGTRPYYKQVCDFLEHHYEHISEVALVGGEPLLLPENERLLDIIPETAIVTLITNLNVDFEKNKVVQKLIKRKNVGWSMSLENVGDRLEYVRHGADWNLLKQNLQRVVQLRENNGHWGGIHAVYNIYSATHICELKQFAHDNNVTVMWQNLFWPNYLDPFLHGTRVASLASREIHKFYDSDLATDAERVFFDHALKKYSQSQENSMIAKQFQQHIHDNEIIYHPDKLGKFAQLWPELLL